VPEASPWVWLLAALVGVVLLVAVLSGWHVRVLRRQLQERDQALADSLQAMRQQWDAAQLPVRLGSVSDAVARLDRTAQAGLQAEAQQAGALQAVQQQMTSLQGGLGQSFEALRTGVDQRLGDAQAQSIQARAELAASQLALRQELQASLSAQLASLAQGLALNADGLRNALNERLAAIQADNAQQLEQMRKTVDERLQSTLEQRLGESFRLVSERLEQVHKGLGEMQSLASNVGDLKRVMTNVKTRGTWGEVQLQAILEQMLAPDQYARNVKTVPGSDDMVECAVRLPGRGADAPVWLPIDSKFPLEDYLRLLQAQDDADKPAMQQAGQALESALRAEAKKIRTKYVSPPATTDFAVMYLPSESLFAEALRRPGLAEAIQNDHRVMLAGPANLAAMLNSLQMGFKTLVIEKRSSEVWNLLGQVKTEFGKFGEVVEATRKSIDAAARKFDDVGVRTRAIERRLRDVQEELDAPAADTMTSRDASVTATGAALPR
jgi:DNA recombination protein RmuC